MRSLPEWQGATPDAVPPARVKDRILRAHGDACAECRRPFDHRMRPEFDHAVALINGGENRESNIRPLCPGCHAPKTASDVRLKVRAAKARKDKFGLQAKRSKFPTARNGKWKAKIGKRPERREPE